MRRGGKVRSRMQRAIPEPICRIQLCQSNTHNDSPCLRDEKRWESAKQNATSSTHNDSPCLRDEEPICRIQLCQSNTHNDLMRRGGKVRWKEVQHVRLSLTPAVFSARHFSRRPSVASGGHIRTRRPGPQADSPQHSKDCTRAAPSCQPRNPSKDCAIRQSQSDTD